METQIIKIVAEEMKAGGVEIAEEAIEKALVILFEKALPRVAVEETNTIVKSVAGVMLMVYPTLKPVLAHTTDLNRDGK